MAGSSVEVRAAAPVGRPSAAWTPVGSPPSANSGIRALPDPAESDAASTSREGESNEVVVARYQATHDLALFDELLQRNEGLLHFALKRFAGCGEPYEDLFQVARVGLIKAVQRYDPSRATCFSTYAVAIVDGEVRHHLRDNLLVRQPRWAKALYARIQQAQQELQRECNRPPSIAEIAQRVNVQEEGVLEIIRVYAAVDLHSLDEPFPDGCSPTEPDRTLLRSLRQETFTLPLEDRIMLYDALNVLSEVHRKIIYLLFFKDLTQQQVADEMGMSQRTVSREQTKALGRLKALLGRKIF